MRSNTVAQVGATLLLSLLLPGALISVEQGPWPGSVTVAAGEGDDSYSVLTVPIDLSDIVGDERPVQPAPRSQMGVARDITPPATSDATLDVSWAASRGPAGGGAAAGSSHSTADKPRPKRKAMDRNAGTSAARGRDTSQPTSGITKPGKSTDGGSRPHTKARGRSTAAGAGAGKGTAEFGVQASGGRRNAAAGQRAVAQRDVKAAAGGRHDRNRARKGKANNLRSTLLRRG